METQDVAYYQEQKSDTAPPVKWRWVTSTTGPSPKPRHGHRAVAIRDLMIVFGGGNEGIVDELHVYNTVTNSWYEPEVRGDIPPGSAAYGIVCRDTNIYVFGGMIEFGRYSNELYELQASRWEWRKLRPRPPRSGQAGPCPRLGHSFTLGSDGMSYVFGGLTHESTPEGVVTRYLNDLYVVDLKNAPNGLQWVCPQTHGLSPTPRESHSAVIVENGTTSQLIIYGGMCARRLGDVWILDLLSLTWTSPTVHGVPPEPRSLHTANLVGDRMYIFGGWVPEPPEGVRQYHTVKPEWRCTNTLGIFNVNTLTWEQPAEPLDSVDGLPRPRAGHCSVMINQRIYIWSGRDGYRKSWDTQICCKDMYFLETSPPATPAQIQLVRATMTSLALTWTSVPNADAYILQVQRCGSSTAPNDEGTQGPLQQQLSPRRPVVRTATGHSPVKLVPAGRALTSSSQPVMKVLRTVPSSAPRGQVLRVVTPRGGVASGGATQSPIRPGGQKTIYLSRPGGGPGASQASSFAAPGQRVVLVQQQQPSAVQHSSTSQPQQHVAHVQPRQVVTTYTSSPYQQQPHQHLVQRQIVTTSYQAPQPARDSPPVLQQQARHTSMQHQQPNTSANLAVHQVPVQTAVPAHEPSHIVTASQSQPVAYSQGYSGGQRTTYVSSLSSNIDQQMPHNILDEALNEAENYDAGEDVPAGMEVGDPADSIQQQESFPDAPYAGEQAYIQQATAPSVPAHAGHGNSGPSTPRNVNIPQLDGAGSLEDSDNEAEAATETTGLQQSGAAHSDTTDGGEATASDSRETVASGTAPILSTEGDEAGSDSHAENVPATSEHSNVAAEVPNSEEEQAAADSYAPDTTSIRYHDVTAGPEKSEAQVIASETGAASSWTPDSTTSPDISTGASHVLQAQPSAETQRALVSSTMPSSSALQQQAHGSHYDMPQAIFDNVEDPLQAAVAELDSFEEDPEQLASSVATPVQQVPEPEHARIGGNADTAPQEYAVQAPAYEQQNYAIMMNVPATHEAGSSGAMTPSYHQVQQHPQDPTSNSYDRQAAQAAAAPPSLPDAQHNYAQQAPPAETIQQQPQQGYYAQQAPATQYVVAGQGIPVQQQESGGYTMRTTTGAYPRQPMHGQARQVGIARPQVAVSAMTRQQPQPGAQGAVADAPDVWHDVAIIRGTTHNVKEFLVADADPNSQGYAYVEGALQPIHDRVLSKLSLEPGALYRFRIAAINACGRSPWLHSTTFKTCIPGFPGAPSSIKITKSLEGAQLTWEPPVSTNGTITEYSVYLAVRGSVVNSDAQLAFVRVYAGTEPRCIVSSANLGVAHVENSARPAVIFRIAARNEKGYGPATQVRWLQEAQRPLAGTGAPIYAAPSAGGGFYQRAGAGGPQAAPGGSSTYYPTTKRLRLE